MTRIRIDTRHAYDVARRMHAASYQVYELGHRLEQAVWQLYATGFEGHSRVRLECDLSSAGRRAQDIAHELGTLASRLNHIAEAFERADNHAAAELARIPWNLLEIAPSGQQMLQATRGLFNQLDTLLGYMTAGRTDMQKFLDLLGIRRYGSSAPLLKLGVLDQRFKISKIIGKLGVGVGIFSDILTADHVDERTVSVAVIRNVGEYAVGGAVPVVGIVLAGNALIQLGGAGIVLASKGATSQWATSKAMATDLDISTERVAEAFERIDLGRITKDISELVYDVALKPKFDAVRAVWQDPGIKNVDRLFRILGSTPIYTPDEVMQMSQTVLEDIKQLGGDTFDFVKGVPDLGFTLLDHSVAMGTALVSKTISLVPVPDDWKGAVNESCEQIIDHVVSHPVTVDGLWRDFTITPPPAPSVLPQFGYPAGASWANSMQFAPVVATP
ncbi:MAG: hypothetical protein H5T62_16640 [Anaerolineae bacterium]|nr:hypothetical protein [Anaerolineae bacterium]